MDYRPASKPSRHGVVAAHRYAPLVAGLAVAAAMLVHTPRPPRAPLSREAPRHPAPFLPEPAAAPARDEGAPLHLTGQVGASLYGAARAAGAPPAVLIDYLRAIAAHVSIDAIHPSDRFEMVIARRHDPRTGAAPGTLLYAGLEQGDAAVRLLRQSGGWIDAEGGGGRAAPLALPVAGRLSSGFGMRWHPLLGFTRMHAGIDLAAPEGTPVVAAADGLVDFAGWHGGHGNYVRIGHGAGDATGYGHLSRILVAPGARVRRGEIIGAVGSTGLSTGPHLHFELFRAGRAVDPLAPVTLAPRAPDPIERARLRARVAQLTAGPARG